MLEKTQTTEVENQQYAIQNELQRLKHSKEHRSESQFTSANRPANRSGVSPMKSLLLTFSFAMLIVIGSFARAEISVISCSEAHRLIEHPNVTGRPIVIDTRGGYKDYFKGHIPTAHHLNFDTLRGTDLGVPVQYLPDDLTKALLTRAGIDKQRTHILYATGDKLPNDEILSTSMVAYVLEKFGVEEIRIIDGGLAEWQRQKLPTTQEYFGNPAGKLPDVAKKSIGIDLVEILSKKDKANVVLVDARPHNEYVGEDDIWLRKGHIPGAISFHWARLMEKDNTHKFIAKDKALAELRSAGLTNDKEIVVYCGTSREGSLLRFYLAHVAGFPNVRLYEGSWKEYASLKQYPAETQENKAK
jgi:thiosulfate/3-mercaptopyruvate sulfurtransferase